MTAELRDVAIDLLYVDPVNPRVHIDDADVAELARSIIDHGVDQPLRVRPGPDGGYGVLSGQQRLLAARRAGLMVVPCVVVDVDGAAAAVQAMTGNTGSRPMRLTDEARGYRRLVDEYGMTQAAAAAACGVSQSRVSDLLKLLTLPDDLIARVDDGSMGLQRALATARGRKASGHGVPRGKAARRAREVGALGAVHLTGTAAARVLGRDGRSIGSLVREGRLSRDPVTGGYPLHEVVDLLDQQRADGDGTSRPVRPDDALGYLLPDRVHARLARLAQACDRPAAALVTAAVEDLLRRSRA